MSLKLKFFLFFVLILTFEGCKTQNSNFSSIKNHSNDKNYFLVFRGNDNNGFLNDNFSRIYIKRFFSEVGWPFFMNYNVIPSIDEDPNQGYTEIIDNIQDISSKLYDDSIFILFIDAHGGEEGTCSTGTKDLKAEDVIKALKEGLNKNTNTKTFQRFIIMTTSCYSGEFIRQFQENENSRNGSLFKEGIYIYSTDASTVAYAEVWELFTPPFTLLRELQFRRCNNTKEDDFSKIYSEVRDDIYERVAQSLDFFREQYKTASPRLSTLLYFILSPYYYEELSIIPTFSDLEIIIRAINTNLSKKYYSDDKQGYTYHPSSMNIEFSDEFKTYEKGSIRNKAIFPDIEGCE